MDCMGLLGVEMCAVRTSTMSHGMEVILLGCVWLLTGKSVDRTTRFVRSRLTPLIGLICDLKKPVIFVCGFPTAIGGARAGSGFSFGAAATRASGLVEAARIFLIVAAVGSQTVDDRLPVLASGGG